MKVAFSFLMACCISAAAACAAKLEPEQHQALESLPPALQKVVESQPTEKQQEFLAMPQAQRDAIIAEWNRRRVLMKSYTPAERMAISSMAPEDQDKFFAMSKDKGELFLAERTKSSHEALINCQTLTHRRFGEFISGAAGNEEETGHFTAAEQAIISGLSPKQSQTFFSLPAAQQESFLSDTVRNNTEQLISCRTESHRHLGDTP